MLTIATVLVVFFIIRRRRRWYQQNRINQLLTTRHTDYDTLLNQDPLTTEKLFTIPTI
jgi:hypothetical protein